MRTALWWAEPRKRWTLLRFCTALWWPGGTLLRYQVEVVAVEVGDGEKQKGRDEHCWDIAVPEILGRRAPVECWRASRGAVEVSSDVFTFWVFFSYDVVLGLGFGVFFSYNVVTSLLIWSPQGWRRWRQPGSPCWPCWWKRSQKIVSHLILSLLIASSSWSSSQMPPLLLGADSGCQFLCGDGFTCLASHQVFVV